MNCSIDPLIPLDFIVMFVIVWLRTLPTIWIILMEKNVRF